MAINIVREFLIELKVQTARTARRALTNLDKNLTQVENTAGQLISTLRSLSVVGIGLGTAMGFTAKAAADFGENVRRSAVGLGISEKEYQRLHGTFGLLDADIGDLQDALGTVTDRVTDALEGNKTYRKELKRLGLDIKSLKGKNPAQLFEAMAEAGAKVADKNQVVTAAVRLFGDDLGRKLLPALVGGGENLKELGDRLEATGLFMSEYGTFQTKRAAMEYRLLWYTLKGLTRLFGTKLAPVLAHYSKLIQRILVQNKKFLETAMDDAVDTLFRAFQHLVAILGKVNAGIHAMGGYEALFARLKLAVIGLSAVMVGMPLVKLFLAMGPAVGAANVALKGVMYTMGQFMPLLGLTTMAIKALAVIKFGALIAGIVLVVLALEDLWAFANGGLSVIGDMIQQGGVLGEAIGFVAQATVAVLSAFVGMGKAVGRVIAGALGDSEDWREGLLILAKIIGVTLVAAIGVVASIVLMFAAQLALMVTVTVSVASAIWEIIKAIWALGTAIYEGAVSAVSYLMDKFETVKSVNALIDGLAHAWVVVGDAIAMASDYLDAFLEGMGAVGNTGFDGKTSFGVAEAAAVTDENEAARRQAAARAAGGFGVSRQLTVNNSIDARGADQAAVERLPGQLDEMTRRRAKAAFSGGER